MASHVHSVLTGSATGQVGGIGKASGANTRTIDNQGVHVKNQLMDDRHTTKEKPETPQTKKRRLRLAKLEEDKQDLERMMNYDPFG